MPPKRASTGAGAPASKRSRRSTDALRADAPTPDAEAEAPTLPKPRRSGRWAKPLSGSANADMSYKIITQDPLKAYEYELLCKPPFDNGEDEEDEDEDQPGKCDGGKTCLCMKPASEKPDHPWKMTLAGQTLFCTQRAMCDLRDPDGFSMYTFNDHSAYGTLEVLQNLMLDYEAASKNYKEQWAICEALGFFLSTTHGAEVALLACPSTPNKNIDLTEQDRRRRSCECNHCTDWSPVSLDALSVGKRAGLLEGLRDTKPGADHGPVHGDT